MDTLYVAELRLQYSSVKKITNVYTGTVHVAWWIGVKVLINL